MLVSLKEAKKYLRVDHDDEDTIIRKLIRTAEALCEGTLRKAVEPIPINKVERLGFPFAYDHFAEGEGPDPPFLVYRYPKADNFAADGVAYFKQDVLHIEVYTDKKDPALEEQIEAALDESGIFYGKGETWIDSEKLYEVLYEMEVSA